MTDSSNIDAEKADVVEEVPVPGGSESDLADLFARTEDILRKSKAARESLNKAMADASDVFKATEEVVIPVTVDEIEEDDVDELQQVDQEPDDEELSRDSLISEEPVPEAGEPEDGRLDPFAPEVDVVPAALVEVKQDQLGDGLDAAGRDGDVDPARQEPDDARRRQRGQDAPRDRLRHRPGVGFLEHERQSRPITKRSMRSVSVL